MPNNNQMKNVTLSGYQQQVTSSTHPQNGIYGQITDQSLRKLLMNCEKPNINLTVSINHLLYLSFFFFSKIVSCVFLFNLQTNNAQVIRTSTPVMSQIVYQNADTNTNGRVQSVSPQSGMSQKMQYQSAMNKMYQQQAYQSGSSSMMVRKYVSF